MNFPLPKILPFLQPTFTRRTRGYFVNFAEPSLFCPFHKFGDWLASIPGLLAPAVSVLSTCCTCRIKSWVEPTRVAEGLEKGKISYRCTDSNPDSPVFLPAASHCTDCAIWSIMYVVSATIKRPWHRIINRSKLRYFLFRMSIEHGIWKVPTVQECW